MVRIKIEIMYAFHREVLKTQFQIARELRAIAKQYNISKTNFYNISLVSTPYYIRQCLTTFIATNMMDPQFRNLVVV